MMKIRLRHISVRSLDDLRFQDEAVAVYRGAVDRGIRTMLFHGPSGVGKTTLAKLHAYLHAMDGENEDLDDVYLYNCAESGGRIDDMRAIVSDLAYGPRRDRRKVVILDEAQNINSQSQQSLMNVLEDGLPGSVDVIACSMNPDRLMTAFRSRFTEVAFRSFGARDVADVLDLVPERDDAFVRNAVASCRGSFREFKQRMESGSPAMESDLEGLVVYTWMLFTKGWKEGRRRTMVEKADAVEAASFIARMLDVASEIILADREDRTPDDAIARRLMDSTDRDHLMRVTGGMLEALLAANVHGFVSLSRNWLSPCLAYLLGRIVG